MFKTTKVVEEENTWKENISAKENDVRLMKKYLHIWGNRVKINHHYSFVAARKKGGKNGRETPAKKRRTKKKKIVKIRFSKIKTRHILSIFVNVKNVTWFHMVLGNSHLPTTYTNIFLCVYKKMFMDQKCSVGLYLDVSRLFYVIRTNDVSC